MGVDDAWRWALTQTKRFLNRNMMPPCLFTAARQAVVMCDELFAARAGVPTAESELSEWLEGARQVATVVYMAAHVDTAAVLAGHSDERTHGYTEPLF